MGIKQTVTIIYVLEAFMPWWPSQVCWRNVMEKNQPSLISLHLKLNANLASLSKPAHSSALILTDSCRKWKTGDFLSLFVWLKEDGEGEVGGKGGSMTIFFVGVFITLLFWQMFVTVLSHGPEYSQ